MFSDFERRRSWFSSGRRQGFCFLKMRGHVNSKTTFFGARSALIVGTHVRISSNIANTTRHSQLTHIADNIFQNLIFRPLNQKSSIDDQPPQPAVLSRVRSCFKLGGWFPELHLLRSKICFIYWDVSMYNILNNIANI